MKAKLNIFPIFLLMIFLFCMQFSAAKLCAQEQKFPELAIQAPPELSGLSKHLQDNFFLMYQKVSQKLNIQYQKKINCVLVTNFRSMKLEIEKSIGSKIVLPDSIAGVCIKKLSLIILNNEAYRNAPFQAASATFRHELAHLMLGQIEQKSQLPTWFEEGICQWTEQLMYLPNFGDVSLVASLSAPPTFEQIENMMNRGENLDKAYTASRNAVELLLRGSSKNNLPIFYTNFINNGDFEKSFQAAFRTSVTEFQTRWHKNLKPGKAVGALNFLGANWFVILFCTGIFIALIGFLRKQKKLQKVLDKMEEIDDFEDEEYEKNHTWMREIERRKAAKGQKINDDDDDEDFDPDV